MISLGCVASVTKGPHSGKSGIVLSKDDATELCQVKIACGVIISVLSDHLSSIESSAKACKIASRLGNDHASLSCEYFKFDKKSPMLYQSLLEKASINKNMFFTVDYTQLFDFPIQFVTCGPKYALFDTRDSVCDVDGRVSVVCEAETSPGVILCRGRFENYYFQDVSAFEENLGLPYVRGACIVRKFYKEGDLFAEVLLNAAKCRSAYCVLQHLARIDYGGGCATAWMINKDILGRNVWQKLVSEKGSVVRRHRSDGSTYFYSDGCMRYAIRDPERANGIVYEAYAGEAGKAYMTRRCYDDGSIAFYRGNKPQQVVEDWVWRKDGTVLHLDKKGNVVRKSFQERETEDVTIPTAFVAGDVVYATGLRRQDINSTRGVVIGFCVEKDRWIVRFDRFGGLNVKEANLVKETAFLAAKALRAEKKKVVVPVIEEAVAVPPRVDPPVEKKNSSCEIVTCPLSDVPMTDAVLADDGYVYQRGALLQYWTKWDFVSPITGEAVSPAIFPHRAMSSLAKRIDDGHVEDDPPEILVCSITHDIMRSPVLASDGFVYDKETLQKWFDLGKETSPMTNAAMGSVMRADLTLSVSCVAWM